MPAPAPPPPPAPRRAHRARWAAPFLLLAGTAACLVEFPTRFEPGDAGRADAAADAAPIPQERFEWSFSVLGLLVDPKGNLRAFEALGGPGSEGTLSLARVQLDAELVTAVPEVAARALGGGSFRLDLPEVGGADGLREADLTLRLDEVAELGLAEVRSAGELWGGAALVVRHGENEPVGEQEAPVDFRFVAVGQPEPGERPTALMARGGLGSGLFSLQGGLDAAGESLPPIPETAVDSVGSGLFTVLGNQTILRGIRGDTRRMLVAHRWNALREDPDTGDGPRPLPELWLGLRNEATRPAGRELEGRWSLGGVSLEPGESRWRGDRRELVVTFTEEVVAYDLLDADGDVVEAGRLDVQSGSMLPFSGVVGLTRTSNPPATTHFAMGLGSPRYLIVWGTDGRRPATRLYFGLRER